MKQFTDHETSYDEKLWTGSKSVCILRQQLPPVTSEAAMGIALRRLP